MVGAREEKYSAGCHRAERDARGVQHSWPAEGKREKPGWAKEEALILSRSIRGMRQKFKYRGRY